MASSTTSMPADAPPTYLPTVTIPPQLKFLMSNLKNLVSTVLTSDNYPVWRAQVEKLFTAGGFLGFLDGSFPCPTPEQSELHSGDPAFISTSTWHLLDQHLASALLSVISPSIVPYVLSFSHCSDIWHTLALRLQATTRSRLIQLKNELHNLSKGDQTMSQYLLTVKSKVDAITTAGGTIDPEDVILYTLNGLPATYQAFKTSIRTNLQPINLDDLYTLLCSEEIIIAQEATKELQALNLSENPTALAATRGKDRGRPTSNKGRFSISNRSNRSNNNTKPDRSSYRNTICQICSKQGHSAARCWYRLDPNYQPSSQQTALFTSSDNSNPSNWFLDSGASTHLTADPSQFQSQESYNGNSQITIGNGQQLPIQYTGRGILPTPSGDLKLNRLHLVPNLSFNLISVFQLTHDNNCIISFDSNGYQIKDMQTKRLLLQGPCHNGLYPIRPHTTSAGLALLSIQTVPDLWHSRLGHPGQNVLQHLHKLFPALKSSFHIKVCNTCSLAKSCRLSFPISTSSTVAPFELIHSDVWGPAPTMSLQGFKYYVSFVDDYTKYCWIYPLFRKSDVFDKFFEFYNFIKCHFNTSIKNIRTDGGGEYINNKFKHFCRITGIRHQFTCPHTPAQNGTAERKHRHILDIVRSLLIHSSAPQYLWVHALYTAVQLINILPTRVLQYKSPYQILYNKTPNYDHLKIFGCLSYPWLRPYSSSKLSSFSKPCVFIGYAPNQKGYQCLDPNTNHIYTSRHVLFNEQIFPFQQSHKPMVYSRHDESIPPLLLVPVQTKSSNSKTITQSVDSLSLPRSCNPPPSRSCNSTSSANSEPSPNPERSTSIHSISPTNSRHHMITRSKTGSLKPKQVLNLTHQLSIPDPTSYTQASQYKHWRQAMSQEFQALQSQGTWHLVPPDPKQNVLGCKWIYKTKFNADGSIARYKARLVALGYKQEYGLDYHETFSPVAKIPTFRILILLALHQNWPIHQFDVSNAFLHGSLQDTVFMKQPMGFLDHINPNYVCKLNKAIYGLKQSPRQWFETLTGFLHDLGFVKSHSDPSLLLYQKDKIRSYFLIYVDDIIITGNNSVFLQELRSKLHLRFNMKDLGTLSQFLGLQCTKTDYGLLLSQTQYANLILERAGMTNCKSVVTPTSSKSTKLSSPSPDFVNPSLYRQLVGSLQYLTLTRPDITYAVNKVSQHMHQPTEQNFEDLKRILRYLHGSLHIGLPLYRDSTILTAYVDSDWAGDQSDRKSTTGYCMFFGNTLTSWSVKKQATIARSSTEAEYRALASAAAEILWLRQLLQELGCPQKLPTILYCDNTSAIALAHNPVFHARTKHIEVDGHFIRECIQNNSIQVHHISSKDQIADFFTKSLSAAQFKYLLNKLMSSNDSSVCKGVLDNKTTS
ncbi:Retrovirus-related Pol polyprotein from transposon TNT 1-94 [Dendrobium catenatum]|uniref:Retrovirus-related Pol polyprotein from transposon TNT 1-94 n=1 Tax=Dendrobium catenatum TaxID=906689 RepID=A0A2I0WBH2_9ASPA|nr:Retrovirus-related Pol polyprotein from transposon TNT 1-94 [Dendrobium catenatum]